MTHKMYFVGIGLLSLLTAGLMGSTPIAFRLFMALGGMAALAIALFLFRAEQSQR